MPSIPTLLATTAATTASQARTSGPPTPASVASSCATTTNTVLPAANPFSLDATLFSSYSQTSEFSLADLSMLQNFITSTSCSLSPTPNVQHIWGTTIVQMALQHRFLLHGLLTLSALHLFYNGRSEDVNSNRHLFNYAARHQTISLSLYQHALANPTPEQRDALFALSIVIFILAIASLREDNPATPEASGTDAMLDCKWIRLARGILVVSHDHVEEIGRGPLALLLQVDVPLHPDPVKEETLPHDLQNLQKLWQSEDSSLPFYRYKNPMMSKGDRQQTYEEALAALILTRSRVLDHIRNLYMETEESATTKTSESSSPNRVTRARHQDRLRAEIFMWVLRVPEHYIELLEQHDPIALIILAHYSSLLCYDRHSWWCFPSARAIILRVSNFLDEDLRKWIESPMADIRLTDG